MDPLAQLEAPVFCCSPLAGDDLTPEQAQTTADVFKALADATRVRIVNLLARSEQAVCVCDINGHFDLSQPTISHHLKKLTAAGVVTREQRGTWAFFQLDESVLQGLSEVFQTKHEVKA